MVAFFSYKNSVHVRPSAGFCFWFAMRSVCAEQDALFCWMSRKWCGNYCFLFAVAQRLYVAASTQMLGGGQDLQHFQCTTRLVGGLLSAKTRGDGHRQRVIPHTFSCTMPQRQTLAVAHDSMSVCVCVFQGPERNSLQQCHVVWGAWPCVSVAFSALLAGRSSAKAKPAKPKGSLFFVWEGHGGGGGGGGDHQNPTAGLTH